MIIRTYVKSDKNSVLELLKSNTPLFFDPSEEKDFDKYLDEEIEGYFIAEENGKVIGCGGINYFTDKKIARISWDIVDSKSHGKGIGGKLMHHRINVLKSNSNIEFIEVRTSQHAYQFYAKMGFELDMIEENYWAKGFDLYRMVRLNLDL